MASCLPPSGPVVLWASVLCSNNTSASTCSVLLYRCMASLIVWMILQASLVFQTQWKKEKLEQMTVDLRWIYSSKWEPMKDKGKTNYKENHVFFAVYFGCVTFHIQAILTFYVNAEERSIWPYMMMEMCIVFYHTCKNDYFFCCSFTENHAGLYCNLTSIHLYIYLFSLLLRRHVFLLTKHPATTNTRC